MQRNFENGTLGEPALHCIKLCSICHVGASFISLAPTFFNGHTARALRMLYLRHTSARLRFERVWLSDGERGGRVLLRKGIDASRHGGVLLSLRKFKRFNTF